MGIERLDLTGSVNSDSSGGISEVTNSAVLSSAELVDFYLDLFVDLCKVAGDAIYMKGNILLGSLLPDMARSTKDLDVAVLNIQLYNDCVVPALIEFVAGRFPNAKYRIAEITSGHNGGIKVYDHSDHIVLFSVDVSVSPTELYGLQYYRIRGKDILGSSLERIAADKCLATLSKRRYRRVKDFYDLWVLCASRISFNYQVIYELMEMQVGQEELSELLSNYPFTEEVIAQLTHAWNKLEVTAFSDKYVIREKPDIHLVLGVISRMYYELKAIQDPL